MTSAMKTQDLGRPVFANRQVEELGRLVEKIGRGAAGQKLVIGNQIEQEWDVGFHSADAELLQATLHPPRASSAASQCGHLTSSES